MAFKPMLGGLLAAAATTAAIAQPAPPAGQGWNRAARPAETRAQVIQRTQQMFGRLDRNRDGAITQDELAARGGFEFCVGRVCRYQIFIHQNIILTA